MQYVISLYMILIGKAKLSEEISQNIYKVHVCTKNIHNNLKAHFGKQNFPAFLFH